MVLSSAKFPMFTLCRELWRIILSIKIEYIPLLLVIGTSNYGRLELKEESEIELFITHNCNCQVNMGNRKKNRRWF